MCFLRGGGGFPVEKMAHHGNDNNHNHFSGRHV